MGQYKDKNGKTWNVQFSYRDWKGQKGQVFRRGFKTKKEAQKAEQEIRLKLRSDINMTFGSFWEQYTADIKPRLKLNTWITKEHIVENKILPYFKDRKLVDIKPHDVIAWQNEIRKLKDKKGNPISSSYRKTIHNQLSAIFNHAMRYYGLTSNPAQLAGNMGTEETAEMLYWQKEEYLAFAEVMMDKDISYHAFELLYWTGIREGELLALTPKDFDFERKTLSINKSYQRLQGEDVITTPKTRNSNRIIEMPDFLCEEMQDYIERLYGAEEDTRIFPVTKHYLKHEMERGCKASGVKMIRIHDLRHSHVSLLIHMGFTALAIGKRLGHSAEKITYRYAHLFPTVQSEMARRLNTERGMNDVDEES